MSIVLVIVGLIVGGVLVGQDLIRSAAVRAQVSQIEKYNTAVNTFYGKYGALPGDMNAATAAQFGGFTPRGTDCGGSACAGEGDGNGVIEGASPGDPGQNDGAIEIGGETVMFWQDLSTAGLIDANFPISAPFSTLQCLAVSASVCYPPAKLGSNNYVEVWSGGIQGGDGVNYFGILGINGTGGSVNGFVNLSVQEAYNIDVKLDDGLPQSGHVTAMFVQSDFNVEWAGDADPSGGPVVADDGVSTTGAATTCYDNGGAPGAMEKYSVKMNNGAGVNCALSFKFQ